MTEAFIHPLLALGFGNLAMLGWLAAAAAPLLIHLWSRHRHREAPWAAMQFLLAAMRKNARRLQLQQWLLLALRTLLIALVVLAAAEPYGERLLAGGGGGPTHKVLVIDGSYSMGCNDEGMSRFARAKQLAAMLVRDSRPADRFTVILMATPPKTILSRNVIDHSAVAAQVKDLAQPHTGADLAATLTLVREALTPSKNSPVRSERQEVHFFTDLQRSTWALEENPFAALSQLATLNVIDLGQAETSNLAVTSASVRDAFLTLGREITFEAALHRFGQDPLTSCAVELVIDDVPVGEQTIDVPAGGSTTVRFAHRFHTPGEHTVAVRAAGDALNIDNVRWLVVPVREEVRVLCVAGREGAAKYVADALNPDPAGDSPIRPEFVSEGDLAEIAFGDFDCVFLCNVAQLTADEAERLARYAESGGGVVFFLGDRVVPESYNSLAAGFHAERGNEALAQPLLPARLVEQIDAPQFGIDPLEYRHPIVAPFRGRERAGLLTTPIGRYYQLEVDRSGTNVEVAAALRGGDPLIVAAPLGRGRTVLVATDGSLTSVDSAGEPWTQWPTWPSFLPIVRELLAYATGGEQHQSQQLVGSPLVSPAELAAGRSTQTDSDALQIMRPDGRNDSVVLLSSLNGSVWNYTDTDVSGIYAVRGLARNNDTLHFAVNVATTESDLAMISASELPAELQVRGAGDYPRDNAIGTHTERAAWNQTLLWTALGILVVESYLAWQFGRGAV